jgi:integrase
MLTSTLRKPGRPTAHYRTRSGKRIDGLFRLGDGRWRASGPERFTFTEPNEDLAILRFREWQSRRAGRHVEVPVDTAGLATEEAVRKAAGVKVVMTAAPDGDPPSFSRLMAEAEFWAVVRHEILTRPQYVAQQTGIEQIGYLTDLPKPTPSPSLDDVGKLYLDHAKISDNWRAKCRQFWREFTEAVEVVKLREITQEHVVEYADLIHAAAGTPTYARQRFGAVKAIINYPTKRGKWAQDAKRALAFCAALVPPSKSAADPNPIDPDDFSALLAKADDTMRAVLLLSLNACMYGGEVAAVNWSELDLDKGTLVTERNKTKVVRVAMLWPETVKALRKLPRSSDAVFLTEAGTQADYLCIYRLFKIVRKAAETGEVQFAQIRDGAYTAAVEAGVDLNVCRLLAGHATGISDAYVKRRPAMVAVACEAVRRAYFGM